LVSIRVVADDGAVVTRSTSDTSTVTRSLFNVGDIGTFGHLAYRKNVTDLKVSLLTAENELAGIETFDGNKVFLDFGELVRMTESDTGKGGTTSRIVDDLLDNTLNVAMTFTVVIDTEGGGTLTVLVVGLLDRKREREKVRRYE
jgi:hypothetical protein